MRRPKPQPKETRVPRLRNASPPKHGDTKSHERHSNGPSPRVMRGKTFRLRNVNRD
jgi:hypothetical protein